MTVSEQEYSQLINKNLQKSKTLKNSACAFFVGGTICTLGQFLYKIYQSTGLSELNSGTLVSVSLIFLSVLLTALHIYDNIAKFAGAGSLVPITGFANAVVSPAMEFKSEGLILGLGAKMFIISGPVLVYGITASIVYGVIVYCFHLY